MSQSPLYCLCFFSFVSQHVSTNAIHWLTEVALAVCKLMLPLLFYVVLLFSPFFFPQTACICESLFNQELMICINLPPISPPLLPLPLFVHCVSPVILHRFPIYFTTMTAELSSFPYKSTYVFYPPLYSSISYALAWSSWGTAGCLQSLLLILHFVLVFVAISLVLCADVSDWPLINWKWSECRNNIYLMSQQFIVLIFLLLAPLHRMLPRFFCLLFTAPSSTTTATTLSTLQILSEQAFQAEMQ